VVRMRDSEAEPPLGRARAPLPHTSGAGIERGREAEVEDEGVATSVLFETRT
jgi:hypothetical protein